MFDKILSHSYQSDLPFLSRLDFPHAPLLQPVLSHYIFGCWLPVICNKIMNLEGYDDKLYLGGCLGQEGPLLIHDINDIYPILIFV